MSIEGAPNCLDYDLFDCRDCLDYNYNRGHGSYQYYTGNICFLRVYYDLFDFCDCRDCLDYYYNRGAAGRAVRYTPRADHMPTLLRGAATIPAARASINI